MRALLLGSLLCLLAAAPARAGQAHLTWTDNSSGTGQETAFDIERLSQAVATPPAGAIDCATVTGTWTALTSVGADVTTYDDPAAPDGAIVCYRVRARNAGGSSAYSNVSGKYVAAPPPPAPTNLTVTMQFQGGGAGGRVTSLPDGIDTTVQGTVSAQFPRGTDVTLVAQAKANRTRFIGWGGACAPAGDQASCSLTMSADQTANALFVK